MTTLSKYVKYSYNQGVIVTEYFKLNNKPIPTKLGYKLIRAAWLMRMRFGKLCTYYSTTGRGGYYIHNISFLGSNKTIKRFYEFLLKLEPSMKRRINPILKKLS